MSRTFRSFTEISSETLKDGDIIYIANIRHLVIRSSYTNYYLSNIDGGSNADIFDKIGVDKIYLLESLGYRYGGGDFPELSSLTSLTHYVKHIMMFAENKITNIGKIKFSDSFLQFLRDGFDRSNICKVLLENMMNLDVSKINYITNRYDEYISYMPSNKTQEINEDGSWIRKNRQQGKPSKIIRQLFTDDLLKLVTDSDFEIFSNLYKSINNKQGQFKIVNGDEIRLWYSEQRYKSSQGTLNNSCMRYDNCQKFFGLYTENPDIIKMLVLLDEDGLLLGRALLWHTKDNINLMDRIYGSDSTIQKFIMWAYDNNYYIKKQNNNTVNSAFVNKEVEEKFNISIQLPNLNQNRFPYMDTFCFMDIGKTTLTNDSSIYLDGYELRCTGGSLSKRVDDEEDDDYDDDTRCCYVSGRTIYINDNAVWIESICEYVHEDYAVYCEASQEYILERDSFECAFSGHYYDRDYGVEIIGGSMVYENDRHLVCLADGRYCHIDDSAVCDYDGERYYKKDVISIEVNGIDNFVYSDNVEAFKTANESESIIIKN
jgi:hypothetical protein